jgi:hypothetical protein
MVNERDVEVFIICLSCHFDIGKLPYPRSWSIKLWFHTEGKLTAMLIIPSSWGFPTGPVRHQCLDPIDDHLPERSLGNVRSISRTIG